MNTNKKSRTAGTVTAERAAKKRYAHKLHINYSILFEILQVSGAVILTILFLIFVAIHATAPNPQYIPFEYRVSYGETLWGIAERYKPDNVTMQDYMGWVYAHNDGGFIYPGDVVIMAEVEE